MGNNSLSRRTVLSGLAAAPLVALPAVASPSLCDPASPELRRLIDAHLVATSHFEAVCSASEYLYDPGLSAAWRRASQAEEGARANLLACPLRSADDVRALARHFVARLAPDMGDFAEPWAATILIRNLALMGDVQ